MAVVQGGHEVSRDFLEIIIKRNQRPKPKTRSFGLCFGFVNELRSQIRQACAASRVNLPYIHNSYCLMVAAANH